MDEQYRAQICRGLQRLAAHSRATLSEEKLRSYLTFFRRFGWRLEEFEAACWHFLSESKWMPEPYDFTQWRRSFTEMDASEAWAVVLEFTRGAWRYSKSIGDPAIDSAVAALGGYKQLAIDTPSHYLPLRFEKFAEFYTYQQEKEKRVEVLPASVKQMLEERRNQPQLEIAASDQEDDQ